MPRTVVTHDNEAGSSRPKRTRVTETVEETMIGCVHHEFLLWGTCDKTAKTKDAQDQDEELITKKLIKFRLGGHGHSLTLLEFARRLGLYHSAEICEEGFEVYFEGGLRSDKHFNARDYWLIISSKDELHLIAKKMSLLTDEVLNGLSALIYGRFMDATTLRELIDSIGEIRQGTLERMSRRQSYHSDRYVRVFEFMAGHYGVLLDGAYAPPGYDDEEQQQE
ncbi:hypothetical protein Tco_0543850 [Tanacetum coccineum]